MAESTHPIYEGAVGRQLRFDFPEPWQALKFDESAWYRNTIKTRVKAMDLVAFLEASPAGSGIPPETLGAVRDYRTRYGI